MATDEKKGITVKVDADLHTEVRQYLESHGMTMAEFVSLALQDELHPKMNVQEEKAMGNMRTIAFQIPETLFQRIKEYLQRNNMTQKEFMIGLIENELERDLTQREATGAVQGHLAGEVEETAELEETGPVEDFVASSEENYDSEYYDEDEEEEMADQEDEEQSESQGMDFSMSM